MVLHVALTHQTRYRFGQPVELGPHVVRLRPAPHCRTPILAYSLGITPKPHFLNWQQDPFGNFLARVVVPDKATELGITVDLVADMATIDPFDFFVDEAAARWPFAYAPELSAELAPYLEPLPATPLLESYLKSASATDSTGTIDFVTHLDRALARDIAYRVRMEAGVQTPEVTLASRSGSCRDSGWLLVQLLRRIGLAARFVSGYLIQLRPDARPAEGLAGAAEDFTDLHAWAEVYIPGAGWIGLDPTSGLLAGEGHIPLAATPSPTSAAPITGTHGATGVDFAFTCGSSVCARRRGSASRTPRRSGRKSSAAGAAVDARLAAGDVRLSMGGEPTFVALGISEAPEWNIAALGPSKRDFADKLARRLCARFAKGGPAALRTGQVVSGRDRAPVGLRHPLARRRRATVARSRPDRRGEAGTAGDDRRRAAVCERRSPARWVSLPTPPSPPTRTPPLCARRAEAAAGRCAGRQSPRRCGRARAPRTRLRARPRYTGRLRAAAARDTGTGRHAGSARSAGRSGAGTCT